MPTTKDDSDLVQMTEEKFEAQLSVSHYAGRASAYEDAAASLLEKAGNMFAMGHDEKAHTIRMLAKDLEVRGKEERKRQQENEKLMLT